MLPPGWRTSVTRLPAAADRQPHHYLAADFDTLVDSPIYAGIPSIYEFQVDGVPHLLVNEGEGGLWDGPRSARDVEAIVRAQKAFWGSLPYEKYVFFNLLDRERRRAGAQELDRADGQPLGHPNAVELPGLAQPRQPRVLPHLERQAAAARRAGPVRLRERGLHAQPLGRRGDHQLLRPPARPPRGALHRRGVPGRRPSLARLRLRQAHQRHRAAADHPRPAGPAAGVVIVSTPGSSSTAATRTRPTPASATT